MAWRRSIASSSGGCIERIYGPPQLERYRAEDFSRLVRFRRVRMRRGVIHILH
jgi:hypothetical protein